jgi:hypothetical protein
MKKRILSMVMVVVMSVSMVIPAGANRSGDWVYEVFTSSGEQVARITEYHGSGGNVIMPSTLDGFPVREFTVSVFKGNTALTGITIPEGITTIPVFWGGGAFQDCTNLTSVNLPNTLTRIDSAAFRNTALRSVIIPDNVTNIGSYAFRNISSLTSVTFGSRVIFIGSGAFSNTSLTSITIGNSVIIGDRAFSGCTSLTSVTIGNGAIEIGDRAFSGCTSLESVTFLSSIPPPSRFFGSGVFENCNALNTIYVPIGTASAYREIEQLRGFDIVEIDVRFEVRFEVQLNRGDVDGDGSITINDALEILKYLAGLESAVDFEATIDDALEILKHLAGLPSLIS